MHLSGIDHTGGVLTPSVGISNYSSVMSSGAISTSEHNPQQFYGWLALDRKVWCDWGIIDPTSKL